ncbi:MAG: hypothetical protein EHM32_11455, partial [Spirochaetales bacterium]
MAPAKNQGSEKCGRQKLWPAFLVALIAFGGTAHSGNEKKTDALLFESTGITRSDIEKVAKKESLDLFDVYVLAVSGTERMAIESEYSLQADARRRQALGLFLPRVSLKATKTLTEVDRTTSPAQRSNVSLYARQNLLTGLDEYASFRGSAA